MDFPDYGLSRDGTVWRIKANGAKGAVPYKLRLKVCRTGYVHAALTRGGRMHFKSVHRLMLKTFVGPCPFGHETAHGNGIRADNRIENLRWATKKENMIDRAAHGKTRPGWHYAPSLLSRGDVEWIRAYPKRRGMFREMGERLQVSAATIRLAYLGKNWARV